jgi:hypothetical protein
LEPETVYAATKNKGMFNLIENEHVVKIDFIVRKDNPYRRREVSRRKRVVVDNRGLYLVAPEDLILQARMGQGVAVGNAVDAQF